MSTITQIIDNFVSNISKLNEGINVEYTSTCSDNVNFVLWQLQ